MHPEDQDALRSSPKTTPISDSMTDNRSQLKHMPGDAAGCPCLACIIARHNDAQFAASQKAELANLAAMRDDEIDTSDIPETTDWAGAERGKFYRGVDQPRQIDPARLEALRLAAANGGNHEVIVAAARAFLAFLDPGSAETVTGPDKVKITVEGLAPQAEELPPYLAAEVGDVVEVEGDFRSAECAVVRVDDDSGTVETCRCMVLWPDGGKAWAINEWIKRIVHKASETGQ